MTRITQWARPLKGTPSSLSYVTQGGTPKDAPSAVDRYSHNGVTKSWRGTVERGKLRYHIQGQVKPHSRASSLDDDPRPTKGQRKAALKMRRNKTK
jgi:hypothetical protein